MNDQFKSSKEFKEYCHKASGNSAGNIKHTQLMHMFSSIKGYPTSKHYCNFLDSKYNQPIKVYNSSLCDQEPRDNSITIESTSHKEYFDIDKKDNLESELKKYTNWAGHQFFDKMIYITQDFLINEYIDDNLQEFFEDFDFWNIDDMHEMGRDIPEWRHHNNWAYCSLVELAIFRDTFGAEYLNQYISIDTYGYSDKELANKTAEFCSSNASHNILLVNQSKWINEITSKLKKDSYWKRLDKVELREQLTKKIIEKLKDNKFNFLFDIYSKTLE
jgi:hypothetical protein